MEQPAKEHGTLRIATYLIEASELMVVQRDHDLVLTRTHDLAKLDFRQRARSTRNALIFQPPPRCTLPPRSAEHGSRWLGEHRIPIVL